MAPWEPTSACTVLCVLEPVPSPGKSTSVTQGAVGQLRGLAQQGPLQGSPPSKTPPVQGEQKAPFLCCGTSMISSLPILATGETEAQTSMLEGVSCPWSGGMNQVCAPGLLLPPVGSPALGKGSARSLPAPWAAR